MQVYTVNIIQPANAFTSVTGNEADMPIFGATSSPSADCSRSKT